MEASIIFSDPMVRAILAGKKTQTRRIAKSWRKHRFHAGMHLWVREVWRYYGGDEYLYQRNPRDVRFRADMWAADNGRPRDEWRTPLFMPRWASRIVLTVTEVRREPLHRITTADCIAEGVDDHEPKMAFALGWNRIHGEGEWQKNPWLDVITFEVTSVRR